MSRKITLGAALALALLMVAASIPLTMLYAQAQQNKLILDLPTLIDRFSALEDIKKTIDDHFYENAAKDEVNAGIARGYIDGLGDAGSRYLSAEEYQSYMERLEGKTPELGITLTYSPEELALLIDQVKAGSTAAVSGLKPGDQIVKAESGGKELFNQAVVLPDDAADAISKFYEVTAVSTETSSVAIAITFKRGGEYRPPANVMLGSAVKSVSYRLIDAWAKEGEDPEKNVGYIKIFYFFKNTAEQLEAAVKELSRLGAVSYILDVRGCWEGNLDSVCSAIDLFAGAGEGTKAMVTVYRRGGVPDPRSSTANSPIMSYTTGGYIAVLINRATSGVAELFAYDLRAYNPTRVFLVGDSTRGQGTTVQEPFPLSSVGGAALLTVGTIVPYDGNKNWNAKGDQKGVQPNEPSEADIKAEIAYRITHADQQLPGALSILYKLNQNS